MSSRDPYPEIGRMLAAAAGRGWDSIVLQGTVESDWAEFQATAYRAGQAAQSLSIPDANALHDLCLRVREITESVGHSKWRTIRFSMKANGEFETDFGY
jgi:hypothetical protein